MKDIVKLKERILQYTSLADALRSENVIKTDLEEEQIHCPFHGPDHKKSARFYRRTDTLYCWTCKKKWDLFSYLMQRDGLAFMATVDNLVIKHRIDISGVPEALDEFKEKRIQTKKTQYDVRALSTEKIKKLIRDLKEDITLDMYVRLVFSYMKLKAAEDEEFQEILIKIRDAILKIKKDYNSE